MEDKVIVEQKPKVIKEKVKKAKPRLFTVIVKKNIIGKRIFSVKYNPYTDVTAEEKAFLKKHGAI